MTEQEMAALAAFAKEVVSEALADNVYDCVDIQETALKHGLLLEQPYDPNNPRHEPDAEYVAIGDPYLVYADWFRRLTLNG